MITKEIIYSIYTSIYLYGIHTGIYTTRILTYVYTYKYTGCIDMPLLHLGDMRYMAPNKS